MGKDRGQGPVEEGELNDALLSVFFCYKPSKILSFVFFFLYQALDLK